MNFLSGKVVKTEQGFSLSIGSSSLALPTGFDFKDSQSVVLGIRPEHLRADATGALKAEVEVVEPMGNETHITCRRGDDEIILIESAEITLKPGADVSLTFDTEKAHFFDQESQARIPRNLSS